MERHWNDLSGSLLPSAGRVASAQPQLERVAESRRGEGWIETRGSGAAARSVAGQAKLQPKGCAANVPGRGRRCRAMCRCRARLNHVKGVFRRTRRCAIADVSHSWSPYKVSCGQVTVGGTNTGGGRLSRTVFERQLDDPRYNTEIVSGRLTRTHFFDARRRRSACLALLRNLTLNN
jgi:hypothetical protein